MDKNMCFHTIGAKLVEHKEEATKLKNSVSRLLECANGKNQHPVCRYWVDCMKKKKGTMATFKGFAKALMNISRRAANTAGTGLLSINQSLGALKGTTTAKPEWCSSAEEDEGSPDLMKWCQCQVAIGEHLEEGVVALDEIGTRTEMMFTAFYEAQCVDYGYRGADVMKTCDEDGITFYR